MLYVVWSFFCELPYFYFCYLLVFICYYSYREFVSCHLFIVNFWYVICYSSFVIFSFVNIYQFFFICWFFLYFTVFVFFLFLYCIYQDLGVVTAKLTFLRLYSIYCVLLVEFACCWNELFFKKWFIIWYLFVLFFDMCYFDLLFVGYFSGVFFYFFGFAFILYLLLFVSYFFCIVLI